MKNIFTIVFAAISTIYCTSAMAQAKGPAAAYTLNQDSLKREMAKQKKATAAQFAKTKLTTMVTNAADSSFGYYILADGNILIDQKNIPGVPGNKGFVSTAEAKRTADFAIKKLKQGEMPPTISVEDLKKLKISLPAALK
jgi:hypothetical protein